MARNFTPTFEHRHFKAIAAILNDTQLPKDWWNQTVETFADALEETNPKFDRARFLSACSGKPSNGRDVVSR